MKVYLVEKYWDNRDMYEDFENSIEILEAFDSKEKAVDFAKHWSPDVSKQSTRIVYDESSEYDGMPMPFQRSFRLIPIDEDEEWSEFYILSVLAFDVK